MLLYLQKFHFQTLQENSNTASGTSPLIKFSYAMPPQRRKRAEIVEDPKSASKRLRMHNWYLIVKFIINVTILLKNYLLNYVYLI